MTEHTPASPLIELRSVSRTFPGEPPVQAVRDVSLAVAAGALVAITGASGSGKSTLLNILGLLDVPTSGEYFIAGRDIATHSDRARAALRGATIGFVFQDSRLIAHRSVTENVAVGLMYCQVPHRRRTRMAHEALELVGLSHRLNAMPETLSGGERQRVAIARALAKRPALLLADEPTGNLDSANTAGILELFTSLNADGHTILIVTHDTGVASRCGHQLHMSDGHLADMAPAS